jgi:valyl-tRNA synthetase
MPFITEEIWGKLMTNDEMGGITEKSSNIKDQISKQDANQKSKTNSIMLAEWPKVSEGEINIEAEMTMRLLMELVTSIRNVKAEMSVQTKEVDLIFVAAKKAEREILQNGIRLIKFLTKAAKVEIVESLAKKPEQSASGIVGEIQFFVPLKGLIDIGREVERLKKEIGKIDSEMDRLKGLLAKEDFVAKAPPETIAKQKEKIVELEEKKKLLSARVKDLS